jgi:hypothetical protein
MINAHEDSVSQQVKKSLRFNADESSVSQCATEPFHSSVTAVQVGIVRHVPFFLYVSQLFSGQSTALASKKVENS